MITSLQNDKVKYIRQLQEDGRLRRNVGSFIIEGEKMVNEAPIHRIRALYYTQKGYEKIPNLLTTLGPIPQMVSDEVFNKMSSEKTPQGLLAEIAMDEASIEVMINDKKRLILVDSLQDPGNLGTILRTLDAVGEGALIIGKGSVDIYHPKVVKATMGAIFRVPFISQSDLVETIPYLQQQDFTLWATTLTPKSQQLYKASFLQKEGFIIGNEGKGIQSEIIELANHQLYIPMDGQAESLNAGVAASVVLYEHFRQDRYPTKND